MLHVQGGSVVLEKLRAVGLPGAFLEWVDVLCQGPLPAGADGPAWLEARAAFLDAAYGAADARKRLAAQDDALARALAEENEVVLWFSADWFCQAILVCLLATRLADRRNGSLSLISVGSYPGVNGGGCTLAFLSAEQLREVFAGRSPVTPELTTAARRAWDALRSPDPRAVQTALPALDALPFAAEGLARHLREFPAPRSGVNRTEYRTLAAVRDGARSFAELFPRVADQEERPWITDLMFAAVLRRLASGPRPLVAVDRPDGLQATAGEAMRSVRLAPTDDGRAVLDGSLDWIAAAGIDGWVGGVHLTPANDWRWDEARSTVARAPQSA